MYFWNGNKYSRLLTVKKLDKCAKMGIQLAHHQEKSTNQILNKIFWLNLIQTKPNQNTKPEKENLISIYLPLFLFACAVRSTAHGHCQVWAAAIRRSPTQISLHRDLPGVCTPLHFHRSLSSTIAMLQGIALWSTHRSSSARTNSSKWCISWSLCIGLSCTFAPHDLPCNALYLVLKSYACPCNRWCIWCHHWLQWPARTLRWNHHTEHK